MTKNPDDKSMRIRTLEMENVKRVKVSRIKPKGALIEITGKNDSGKTSTLDGIWWALAEAKHLQDVPIRKGATKAVIRLDLGTLKITRTLRAKEDGGVTPTLKIENEDGFAAKKPQEMLDALVGKLSFDPFAFTRMDAKKQFDQLRAFVPDFDFEKNKQARADRFTKRTEVNRDAKAALAQAEGVKIDEAAAKLKRVDTAALVAKLEEAGQHNASIETRRGNREKVAAEIEAKTEAATAKREEAERYRKLAAQCDAEAEQLSVAAGALQKKLDDAGELPAPIGTTELRAEIDAAGETNKRIDAYDAAVAQKARFDAQAKKLEEEATSLTEAIAALDTAKQKAIASAKMPIEGLSFGDDVVLLNGFPFDQASGAQKLRASCAIAAALNPKLRVLLVKDGALLDDDSMALLREFAETNDMQVWIETINSGRPGAVIMVDGEVADHGAHGGEVESVAAE